MWRSIVGTLIRSLYKQEEEICGTEGNRRHRKEWRRGGVNPRCLVTSARVLPLVYGWSLSAWITFLDLCCAARESITTEKQVESPC
jgi:hypothetical protein